MSNQIQILLATYNGEKFIEAQLDSIFNQTYTNFTILVRDDKSTDNTLKIIQKYIQKYPAKIELLEDNLGNLNVVQNFAILLHNATANYIALCDQDDIWLPNKLEISLQELQLLEQQNTNKPAMVYTNFSTINEDGNITQKLYWENNNLHPKYAQLNYLLLQSICHGCTLLMNKKLAKLCIPISKNAIMHDHWIMLVCTVFGVTKGIETPTLQLRNHSNNVSRVHISFIDYLKRFYTNFFDKKSHQKFLELRIKQAKDFKKQYGETIPNDSLKTINNFIDLDTTNGIKKKLIYIQNKFYRTEIIRTIKMILKA